MEEPFKAIPRRNQKATTVAWTLTALVAATALAGVIALAAPKGPTQLKLPPLVTSANCMAVARGEHLAHAKLSDDTLAKYYAGWVRELSVGGKVSRGTLFDAGLAVSVCLKQ